MSFNKKSIEDIQVKGKKVSYEEKGKNPNKVTRRIAGGIILKDGKYYH